MVYVDVNSERFVFYRYFYIGVCVCCGKEFLMLKSFDFVVVGSGVGGATVAKELSIRGLNVTALEKGGYHKLGTSWRALSFYTGSFWNFCPGEMSDGGVEVLRTVMVGGSSVVTLGNGVRALQKKFKSLEIDFWLGLNDVCFFLFVWNGLISGLLMFGWKCRWVLV